MTYDRSVSTGGYVVLGLLLDGPASGWDLTSTISRSIGHFWPVTKAHVYSELPKLAEKGWAEVAVIEQSSAPTKRVYRATDAGRAAFRSWIDEVELVEERARQPLQLQMFFAHHGDPTRLDELLDAWRERADAREAFCAAILETRGVPVAELGHLTVRQTREHPEPTEHPDQKDGPDDAETDPLRGLDARGMTALFGLRRAQADQVWLEEVRRSLQPGE